MKRLLPFLLFLCPASLLAQGLKIDDAAYGLLLQKRPGAAIKPLPSRTDLSMYAPSVMDQGKWSTCVAVSVGYYMRTILEARRRGLTNRSQIDALRLSPSYLYNMLKDQPDAACADGIDAGRALDYLKQNGLPSLAAVPYHTCQPVGPVIAPANSRLLDYVKLFSITDSDDDKITATKKALSEGAPVVVGIQTTESIYKLAFGKTLLARFQSFASGVVNESAPAAQSQFTRWRPAQATALSLGHALCAVGYDNTKFGTGAVKFINSWGTSWGEGGYFWLSYADFARHAKYGYQGYVPAVNDRATIALSADLTLALGSFFNSRAVPFQRVQSGAAPLTTYAISRPQPTGTPYKFTADVSRQTYLYVITATAAEGVASRLFPEPGVKPLISPNTRLELPKDSLLVLQGKPTLEYCLFLFAQRAIDIDDYVLKLNAQKGPFPDRVPAAFGEALVPPRQVSYKDKKMGFFLKNPYSGYVVPLLVTINHVR